MHDPSRFLPLRLFSGGVFGLVLACQPGPPDARDAAFVIEDSAGIAIVKNRGPAGEPARDGEGLRLDLRIGVTEGDETYQFFRVVEVVLDPATGEIIVANAGSGVLRVYDAAGRWLRTLGRRGTGPGEFTRPGAVTILGDSIFAVSRDPRRRPLHHVARPLGTGAGVRRRPHRQPLRQRRQSLPHRCV